MTEDDPEGEFEKEPNKEAENEGSGNEETKTNPPDPTNSPEPDNPLNPTDSPDIRGTGSTSRIAGKLPSAIIGGGFLGTIVYFLSRNIWLTIIAVIVGMFVGVKLLRSLIGQIIPQTSSDVIVFLAFLFYVMDILAYKTFPWLRSFWSYESGITVRLLHSALIFFAWYVYEGRDEGEHTSFFLTAIAVVLLFGLVTGYFKFFVWIFFFILGILLFEVISGNYKEFLSSLLRMAGFFGILFIDLYLAGYIVNPNETAFFFGVSGTSFIGKGVMFLLKGLTAIGKIGIFKSFILNRLFIPPLFLFCYAKFRGSRTGAKLFFVYICLLLLLFGIDTVKGQLNISNPLGEEQIAAFDKQLEENKAQGGIVKNVENLNTNIRCYSYKIGQIFSLDIGDNAPVYDKYKACMEGRPLVPGTKIGEEKTYRGVKFRWTGKEWEMKDESKFYDLEGIGGGTLSDSTDKLRIAFGELETGKIKDDYITTTSMDIISPESDVELEIRCFIEKEDTLIVHGIANIPGKETTKKENAIKIIYEKTSSKGDTLDVECKFKKNDFSLGENEVKMEVKVLNVVSETEYKFLAVSKEKYDDMENDFTEKNPSVTAPKEERFAYSNALYHDAYRGPSVELFTNVFKDSPVNWDSFSQDKIVKWVLSPDIKFPLIGIEEKESITVKIGRESPKTKNNPDLKNVEFEAKVKLGRIMLKNGLVLVDSDKLAERKESGDYTNLFPEVSEDYSGYYISGDNLDYDDMETYPVVVHVEATNRKDFLNLEQKPENPAEISIRMIIAADYIFTKTEEIEIEENEYFLASGYARFPVDNMDEKHLPQTEGQKYGASREGGRTHNGIDLGGFAETHPAVYPMYDNMMVNEVNCNAHGGNQIMLITNGGKGDIMIAYAHLHKYAKNWKKGEIVNSKDVVGYVGNTAGCYDGAKCSATAGTCSDDCEKQCENFCRTRFEAEKKTPRYAATTIDECMKYCTDTTGLSCSKPFVMDNHLHLSIWFKEKNGWVTRDPEPIIKDALKQGILNK
ncbi:hypothetical protein JXA85_03880 [Candidatus Woesearchaeota archaeon]|nr:hypothetical protein [Candidatus Woesearchaeota archaeon]